MKPLHLLPLLALAGCSSNQSAPVAPAPQTVIVADPPAPPSSAPAAVAPASASGGAPLGGAVLGANLEPTPDPNATPTAAASEPATSTMLVPDVSGPGGVRSYAENVIKRVDGADSSNELMQIRGDIASNTLFFGKASREADNDVERILNQRISTLCESLSDYARNKSDLVEGSTSQENYERVKQTQPIAIYHNAFMADSFFEAHRK